jgi:hypothetical protein
MMMGGCGGGGYVAQLRDFGSFVKQRDSAGDDRGPIGMLMPALSPSCFSWCYLTIFPLSLSYMCRRRKRETTKLCVRDLYRTHLSLPNRKKNTPGLSYLFFSSSSSSALTRQGIPELKTFFEGFVFICRIFWYSSRGQLYFYDRRSC